MNLNAVVSVTQVLMSVCYEYMIRAGEGFKPSFSLEKSDFKRGRGLSTEVSSVLSS